MFCLSAALFKPKVSIFAGVQKLISMNDRRLIRRVGNPVRKYPYHRAHVWNYRKKYMCLDFQNPDPSTTTTQFLISYDPSRDSEVARAAQRVLLHSLPGATVNLEPSESFEIVRLSDNRTIVSNSTSADDLAPLLSIRSPADLIDDLSIMQRLVALARYT